MWTCKKHLIAVICITTFVFQTSHFLTGFWLAWKKILRWKCFFLKSSHFCAITLVFWQICLQNKLSYNFRLPSWDKTTDQELYSGSLTCLDNIRESSLVNTAVVGRFWYFNNNIFSVITPLAFDNDVFFIQLFRLHTWVRSMKWLRPKIGG